MTESNKSITKSRKINLDMEFAVFDFPPCGDILILAKQAPVGPKAAERMLESACPGLFELVEIEDDTVEAFIVKRQLFRMIDKSSLIQIILDEVKCFVSPQSMIRVRCDLKIMVSKSI